MPRIPAAPPGTRVYARVGSFRAECPSCGAFWQCDRYGRWTSGASWNYVTARVVCHTCNHTYGVGIVLWSRPSHDASPVEEPLDHRLPRRLQTQLRSHTVGIWSAETLPPPGEVNLHITSGCTCRPPSSTDDGWVDDCPVHGCYRR